ncbi:MAG: hypothetical protein QME57_01920 [Patescibacteria group bacterium]|nr:hypothetical protein [Patescibacteria group bacterium]
MAKVVENQIVKISKQALKRGVAILDLKEDKELIEKAVPTYHLKGKVAKNLDKLVRERLKKGIRKRKKQ